MKESGQFSDPGCWERLRIAGSVGFSQHPVKGPAVAGPRAIFFSRSRCCRETRHASAGRAIIGPMVVEIRDAIARDLARIGEIERMAYSTPWSLKSFERELTLPFSKTVVASIKVAPEDSS